MFQGLADDDIEEALDELINVFGVAEEIASEDFITPLRKNNVLEWVQEIAKILKLPVRISLSYVPKSFKSGNEGFRTSAMVRSTAAGGGAGIVAQVSIPQHIPIFGSPDLEGFPIRVRISENCCTHRETFITIMAHEFSHVLLASIRHPRKDSELHTDLVPLILGFRRIVKSGRKTVEHVGTGGQMTTVTTTYGYLTDRQFEFACNYIDRVFNKRRSDKERLLRTAKYLQDRLDAITQNLTVFYDYMEALGRRQPKKVKTEHAQRLVGLYALDYGREREAYVKHAQTIRERATSFARPLNYYTTNVVRQLEEQEQTLKSTVQQEKQISEELNADIELLGKYVGFLHKFQRTMRQKSST